MGYILHKCFAVPVTEPQLQGILKRFDADGDGLLNREELKKAFSYLGSRCPGWRANRALYHADANGDGYVSEVELELVVRYALKQGYKIK